MSVNGGNHPKWAQSGREIFYRGLDGGFSVATVRTDPGFVVESREQIDAPPLFLQGPLRHWDLTPDGRCLLAVGTGTSGSTEFIVVQTFFEELRQVVPD